jgi:hypothetical protein
LVAPFDTAVGNAEEGVAARGSSEAMRFSSWLASTLLGGITLASALTTTGCPGSDEKTCSDYMPPASFDATAPVVLFRRDVVPIFTKSCTFTTCHGSQSGNANGVYLGGVGSDPAAVRAGIVDKPAPELPSMAIIKPGAPHDSYLMRKMDASNCLLTAQCMNGDCGDSMPKNDEPLDEDTRNFVRRWIAQGAQDN